MRGWMASLTLWTWVWANSGIKWQGNLVCCTPWIGHNCILQRVGHNLATEQQQLVDWLTEQGLRITLESKWQGSPGEVYGPSLGEDCEGSIHVPLLSVHWKVLVAKKDPQGECWWALFPGKPCTKIVRTLQINQSSKDGGHAWTQ